MPPQRLLLTGFLLLSACAGVSSNCPIPKEYTGAIQSQAADELEALPSGAVLAAMIADYGVMRAEARACAKPEGVL